jgi:alpha-N-arabinofuranosidase
MKPNLITKITLCGLLLNGIYANAQQTTLEVNTSKTITKIQPTMYGVFFEDINFAADVVCMPKW